MIISSSPWGTVPQTDAGNADRISFKAVFGNGERHGR